MQCVRNYFRKKFGYESELFPSFANVRKEEGIDIEVEASGFTREMQKTFDEALQERNEGEANDESESDDEDSEAERDAACSTGTQLADCHSGCVLPSLSVECKEAVDIINDFADLTTQNTAMPSFQVMSAAAVEKQNTAVENPCSRDESYQLADCNCTSLLSTQSVADDNETYVVDDADDLADLTNQNRATRPFRDAPTTAVENLCSGDESSDSNSEVQQRTKPVIDVRVVKQKIKTQHQKQQAKLTARRMIRRGEAAVVTRTRRHNNEAIQHRDGWDF